MASTLTFEDIRAAAERSYGSKTVDLGEHGEVTLVNPMRLSPSKREALTKLQDKDEEAGSDPMAFFEKAFALVSSEAEAKRIHKAFGEDLGLYMALFDLYVRENEVGEASPSQD